MNGTIARLINTDLVDLTSAFHDHGMKETNQTSNSTDFHEAFGNDNTDLLSLSDYHIYWAILDGVSFFLIVGGNILTILAVRLSRSLRKVTSNLFVLNLAISDLMVGLALPYHLAFYLDKRLGEQELTCVMRFVMISLACSSSIYNLIAIAVDRYIAVVHPLKYERHMTKTTAMIAIFVGWCHAIAVSTVPIYWNCFDSASVCELETVLPRYFNSCVTNQYCCNCYRGNHYRVTMSRIFLCFIFPWADTTLWLFSVRVYVSHGCACLCSTCEFGGLQAPMRDV